MFAIEGEGSPSIGPKRPVEDDKSLLLGPFGNPVTQLDTSVEPVVVKTPGETRFSASLFSNKSSAGREELNLETEGEWMEDCASRAVATEDVI